MTNGDQVSRRDEILLKEYEKAQDSAEHHDGLLWGAVALISTGMGGSIVSVVSRSDSHPKWLYAVAAFSLDGLLIYFMESFASIRNETMHVAKQSKVYW